MLAVFALIMFVVALLIPRKKGYKYNSLDKTGVVFNIVLSVLYVPLSLMGLFTVFFADAPSEMYSSLRNMFVSVIIAVGISVPLLSVAGIFTSIVTRKRGRSKFSFVIQFLPLPFFAAILIMALFLDKV